MITIRELIIHLLDEYDGLDTAVALGIWGTDDVIEACTWAGNLMIRGPEKNGGKLLGLQSISNHLW